MGLEMVKRMASHLGSPKARRIVDELFSALHEVTPSSFRFIALLLVDLAVAFGALAGAVAIGSPWRR